MKPDLAGYLLHHTQKKPVALSANLGSLDRLAFPGLEMHSPIPTSSLPFFPTSDISAFFFARSNFVSLKRSRHDLYQVTFFSS